MLQGLIQTDELALGDFPELIWINFDPCGKRSYPSYETAATLSLNDLGGWKRCKLAYLKRGLCFLDTSSC